MHWGKPFSSCNACNAFIDISGFTPSHSSNLLHTEFVGVVVKQHTLIPHIARTVTPATISPARMKHYTATIRVTQKNCTYSNLYIAITPDLNSALCLLDKRWALYYSVWFTGMRVMCWKTVSQESSSTVRKRINNERARTGHLWQQCGTPQTAVRMQCFCHGIEGAGILCVLFPTGLAVWETTFSLGMEQKWRMKNWEGQTFCKEFSVFYLSHCRN